tara:strand:- start:5617 stop:6504 length:888 start_codon:yes stop_codon:yes gene_type:complete
MILKDKSDVVKLRNIQIGQNKITHEEPLGSLKSITINPTELCNRKCFFCPRVDEEIYPNQNLHISFETVRKISEEIKSIEYVDRVGWSGNGEPLLTKDFFEKVKVLADENPQLSVHEIVTNGDRIKKQKDIEKIYNSGINHIIVSLYDGQEQLERFIKLFKNYDKSMYTFKISFEDDIDLKNFTNRGGTVDINTDLVSMNNKNKCFFPFYKLILDWNGDVLICCEDWFRLSKSKLNINTHSLKEIWESNVFNSYRKKLGVGDRSLKPCDRCSINGELIGKESFNLVSQYYGWTDK